MKKIYNLLGGLILGISIAYGIIALYCPFTEETDCESYDVSVCCNIYENVTVNNESAFSNELDSLMEITQWNLDRPTAIKIINAVQENSSKYGIEKSLIYAMIAQESMFNSNALSKKNAKGLMQITNVALKDYNEHCNMNYMENDLFETSINIKIGCWTLLKQKEYIHSDDISDCVISYNSGCTNFNLYKTKYRLEYKYKDKVYQYKKYFEEKHENKKSDETCA